MNLSDVQDKLRRLCEAAGGQGRWAEQNGLAASFISDVLNGRRDPSEKLLSKLGLKRRIVYCEHQ